MEKTDIANGEHDASRWPPQRREACTKAENLREIISTLKEEKQDKNLGEVFILNSKAQEYLLLVPVYKESERILAKEREPQKYKISETDFKLAISYLNYLGEKVALVKYECEPEVLETVTNTIQNKEETERRYDFNEERSIAKPEVIIDRILKYFGLKAYKFDTFKKLENEIVHFEHIRFSDGKKYEEIKRKIEEIKCYPERRKKLDERYGKIPREEYDKESALLKEADIFELNGKKIRIKYL
ncbi:MAG: hypothetical protein QXP36_10540, partial [Conexivisphaerales archaeon]